ncbi:MAG: hypothetical protein KAS32_14520 [Candidatus Peribacteraceae bacterium]|nr:hypothetical protein [Candidatus Peribacteraceae bacterium]
MEFTIKFADIWVDEDDSLDKAMKTYIINEAVKTINDQITEKVKDEYNKQIKAAIDKQMNQHIKALIRKTVRDGTITVSHYNKEEQSSIRDYVICCVKDTRGWSNVSEHVMKYAKQFVEETKKRYDLAFASQIVSKMAEHKLLKDDNVAKLLEKPNVA